MFHMILSILSKNFFSSNFPNFQSRKIAFRTFLPNCQSGKIAFRTLLPNFQSREIAFRTLLTDPMTCDHVTVPLQYDNIVMLAEIYYSQTPMHMPNSDLPGTRP